MSSDPSREAESTLNTAIENGDLAFVQERVTPKTLNLKDRNGMAPLHVAVYCQQLRIVKWLLNQPGIDLALEDGSAGYTPLRASLDFSNEEIRRLLRERERTSVNEREFSSSAISGCVIV